MESAKKVIEKLTLDEKLNLLSGKNFWQLYEIPQFNLQSIMMTDGPHGLRKQEDSADNLGLNKSVPATCYPTASCLASSWDEELIYQVDEHHQQPWTDLDELASSSLSSSAFYSCQSTCYRQQQKNKTRKKTK